MTENPSGAPARIVVPGNHRTSGRRGPWRGVVAGAAVLAFVGASAGTASAAPGDTSSGTTQGNVQVSEAILLTALTPSFTLTGLPGATVAQDGLVTMNVRTNNAAGYAVTVQAGTATLLPTVPGNTDSIPVGNLHVRETSDLAPGGFTSLSSTSPVTVHTQATRSLLGGDIISNDYSVDIPFVNNGTYRTTLTYIATTL